jgi:PAS domain S-box-containing protein
MAAFPPRIVSMDHFLKNAPSDVSDDKGAGALKDSRGTRIGRELGRAALFGIAYYLLAELSRFLSDPGSPYITLWLPAGLYMAGMLLADMRSWPWLALGVLPANYAFDLLHRSPSFLIAWFYAANTTQAVVGAWLVRRFVARRPELVSLKELSGVLGCTALVAPAVAATVGALAITHSGFIDSFFAAWKIWWWNSVSSVLAVTPFFLAWFGRPVAGWWGALARPARMLEAGLLAALLAVFSWYMFVIKSGIQFPLKFQLLPFVLWIGLRLGKRGATLANVLLALWLTFLMVYFPSAQMGGPDAGEDPMMILQTFLVTTVLVSLIPAVVLEERDRRAVDLQESEERFRNLSAAAYEGIAISENGVLVDLNDQGVKMFGYTRQEMIGRMVADFVAPEVRNEVTKNVRASRDAQYELQMVRKDGSRFFVETQARMVNIGPRLLRMAAFRDITVRRQAEISLRESRSKLGLAMDLAQLGQWELDLVTGMLTFDDNFFKLLGTTAPPEGGRVLAAAEYVRRFIPPEDAGTVTQEIRNAAAATDPDYTRQLQHRFTRADGSAGVMLMRFAIEKDAVGRTVRILGVNQDITDQKDAERQRQRLEQQLLQAQKMDALGTLAGGIAHDFNNILTGIIGNLQLAEMDLPAGHPARAALHHAGKAGRRASELVARILTFSRRGASDRVPTRLGPVVHEALQLLRASIPASIEIRMDIANECPSVLCDVAQIHQVIMNLGTNAAHAMREHGGVLGVELRREPPGPEWLKMYPQVRPEHQVRLSVSDTGTGMAADVLQRIFEPFFTTKRPGEGTGLGLTMAYGIMQNHGGTISVESVPGRGSTFILYFPAEGRADPNVTPSASEPPFPSVISFGRGRRILLVDDDGDVLEVAGSSLKRLGFEPETFSNPVAALEKFRTAPGNFSAAITDLTMPGMNGVELTRQMLLLRPDLPVILTSGYLHGEAHEEMRRLKVRHFIKKPFSMTDLAAQLRLVLGETPV